jgi:hypothetical protein
MCPSAFANVTVNVIAECGHGPPVALADDTSGAAATAVAIAAAVLLCATVTVDCKDNETPNPRAVFK